jgi:hypothetical protein
VRFRPMLASGPGLGPARLLASASSPFSTWSIAAIDALQRCPNEAIVEAVLAEAIGAHGAEIDALTSGLDGPAEIISVAHRSFVRRAGSEPEWGWLLLRLDVSHNVLLAALAPYARRDLRRGLKTGRFQVANEQIALHDAGGGLLSVMRAVLDGNAPKDADVHNFEGVMRLFGLAPDEAAEVARRPRRLGSAPPPLERYRSARRRCLTEANKARPSAILRTPSHRPADSLPARLNSER